MQDDDGGEALPTQRLPNQKVAIVRQPKRPTGPSQPRSKTEEFDVEDAFNRYHALSVADDFPPTNFHVIWPQRPEYHRPTSSTKLADRDTGAETHRPTSYPARLNCHSQSGAVSARRASNTIIQQSNRNVGGVGGGAGPNVRYHQSSWSGPVPNMANKDIRPRTTRPYTSDITATPGPGSYLAAAPATADTANTFSRSTAPATGATGAGKLGPGQYDLTLNHDSAGVVIDKEARFNTVNNRTPGPGAYHSQKLISDQRHTPGPSYRPPLVGVSSAESKNRGPGQYNPSVNACFANGTVHKFSQSVRFREKNGIGRVHVLSSRIRKTTKGKAPKRPDISQFTVQRREERILEKKQHRVDRLEQAQRVRQELKLLHESQMGKIRNKEQVDGEQKKAIERNDLKSQVQMRWLLNTTLVGKTSVLVRALIAARECHTQKQQDKKPSKQDTEQEEDQSHAEDQQHVGDNEHEEEVMSKTIYGGGVQHHVGGAGTATTAEHEIGTT